MRKGSRGLYSLISLSALALGACASKPEVIYKPQIVQVPVATCPKPAVLPSPHEWVYELAPGDPPDKVMKYSEATIDELETAVSARDKELGAYRK